ncbi:poly(ethylene terephthalate) hydrolase family protein [Pseudoduganella chitinolytica]|uniref:Dienelactone hydrolase family protein n=1 Tax=Pseudoduganella chitinolytica TaxID=34070 RepID=A0ABY8BH20_9BURK|nr:dienelactone hydrolase family protein [Pseudoduganella chitinolytica]WEF33679.1 dienelactone hydrolase family protein [Pseudoduganella chitinolytica]
MSPPVVSFATPLATLFIAIALSSAAHADPGFAGLQPGPLAVGWKTVQQYDASRTYRGTIDAVTGQPVQGERARPIQTLIWYPARKGGEPVRYGDYLRTEATDEAFDLTTAQVEARVATARKELETRLGAGPAAAMLAQRMWAVRDAAPAAGKYPVVLYAPGVGGPGHEPADLGEYLASHGYIVIASRNLGARTRMLVPDTEGVETQMRDIQFLLSHARSLPQADMTQVAVAGWSWGGMTNVFAAERDQRIRALISLDGTREPEQTRRIDRHRITVPWLYIQRRPETVAELSKKGIDTSFSLLNEVAYADVYQVVMQPMQHADFSSAALREANPGYFREYSRAEVEQAYHWTARYMLQFLNATLKNDAAGKAFLGKAPAENGVPRHLALLRHTPARPGPVPNREGFTAALAQRGFGHATELYRELNQRNKAFVLSDHEINSWGYALLRQAGNVNDAIAMFTFGTTLYPDNANLFDSLGEAQEHTGNTAAAVTSYRRSLALDPGNVNAATRLATLAPAQASR